MMAAAAYDDLDDDADADEAAWDPDMPPPVYCTNCTARLYISDRCSDCGHSNEQDSELLTCSAVSADAAAAGPAGECPLIIWDESMLLHQEGKLEPHPERPDRLRAVMAQLSSNGLTGGWGYMPRRAVCACVLLFVGMAASCPGSSCWLQQHFGMRMRCYRCFASSHQAPAQHMHRICVLNTPRPVGAFLTSNYA
jgi:hypothetical protein